MIEILKGSPDPHKPGWEKWAESPHPTLPAEVLYKIFEVPPYDRSIETALKVLFHPYVGGADTLYVAVHREEINGEWKYKVSKLWFPFPEVDIISIDRPLLVSGSMWWIRWKTIQANNQTPYIFPDDFVEAFEGMPDNVKGLTFRIDTEFLPIFITIRREYQKQGNRWDYWLDSISPVPPDNNVHFGPIKWRAEDD